MASFLPLPKTAGRAAAGVAVVLLMLVAWGSWRAPAVMWAPGDISRVHADVERCRDCHEAFVGITAGSCLHCHTAGEFDRHAALGIADLHRPFLDGSRDCMDCHTEHRGALAAITVGGWANPHGEFVFRATGADSCGDCHDGARLESSPPALLDNNLVRNLYREGEGAHRRGRTADCLRCHRGGRMEPDEVGDDD
ncbi:MAG: cytochrome c3 family protein [Gammaproteobacteria bacterium]